ncbi:hypothetical protein EV361DRAFT_973116 [Lentinula raphanica]|nr:hypothetical protein EV361DRAFT_973116 [Lentinula raphanica]
MDYSPYPNKLMMLLDIMDNLPRLRMSSAYFKLMLWLLTESGVMNIPTYYAFRKMQSSLQASFGNNPRLFKSALGNHFYVNNPCEAIKRETARPISEVWQCEHWKKFLPSEHTPMFSCGKQFYIDKVAVLEDGHLVMPVSWIIQGGILCANTYSVTINEEQEWILQRSKPISVPSCQFHHTSSLPMMPNPDRKLVPKGFDLYDIYYPLWVDDVSGNKLKQYNKHINMYTVNSNLPGQLLQQEYFVQFLSTFPDASSSEQLAAVTDMIKATHRIPILCYNAATKSMCGIWIWIPSLPADNPQQAEEACYAGGNSNYLCRKCKAGGPHDVAGIARSAAETRECLQEQIKAAMTGVKSAVTEIQRATGTKDKVTQHWIDLLLEKAQQIKHNDSSQTTESISAQLEAWLEEQPGWKMNPLLDVEGLDPTQDTPLKILHTILLGIVKYVWYMLTSGKIYLGPEQKNLFVVCLQSTDLDGLTTMAFHVHDLVTPAQFTLIKSVGELGTMLWIHEIDNMDTYLEDLEIMIGKTLDAFASVDPAKIINKVKIHLLPHIIPDIQWFGPIIQSLTEGFKCFNVMFCLCSVFSNDQAPSRDIAQKFSGLDHVKYIISGGYYYDDPQQEWVQASPRVLSILKSHPIIQCHLGWIPCESIKYGALFCNSVMMTMKTHLFTWSLTKAASVLKKNWSFWNNNYSVIAASGDKCVIGSWIAVRDSPVNTMCLQNLSIQTGTDSTPPNNLVTIEHFVLSPQRHPEFDLPVLYRPQGDEEVKFVIAETKEILFQLSAQHDCRSASGSRNVVQEHQVTLQTTNFIKHSNDDRFIINMYGLHNVNLI